MIYKKIIKYILILSVLIIVFIILNFYKFDNKFFQEIITLGLWTDNSSQNEYEISSQTVTEIDVFTTIYNKNLKKIAPGSKGNFSINFKRPKEESYNLKIKEKTSKLQNLYFILDNIKYSSIKNMEDIIEEKFMNSEKITINWEWEYYVSVIHDIQDTIDGKIGENYIFEIEVIIEEKEMEEI